MTPTHDVREVGIPPRDLAPLLNILPADRKRTLLDRCREWHRANCGHIWHVNSTADGGGVAELIRAFGGYAQNAGLSIGWLVIDAPPEFFTVTKRIDNGVSGTAGDGGPLGEAEQDLYTQTSDRLGRSLARHVRPGDHVVLHDPQTAGLARYARDAGATVVWRAHNGCDQENQHTRRAWDVLLPHIAAADIVVTTLERFAPRRLRSTGQALAALAPCLDPFAPRNVGLSDARVRAELAAAGLGPHRPGDPGSRSVPADVVACGTGPAPTDPLIVQVSRWDAVKDMTGTMQAFADYVAPHTDAHLLLAGPEVHGIADDPEAAAVYRACVEAWQRRPAPVRARIRLACLPMDDLERNALLVNALQRRADVVTQKSTSEGFGLTATEAMWKGRAVVVGDVGGLGPQVDGGRAGVAVPPRDHHAFGREVCTLLADPETRTAIGGRAREHVIERFLPDTHITQELALLGGLARRAAA